MSRYYDGIGFLSPKINLNLNKEDLKVNSDTFYSTVIQDYAFFFKRKKVALAKWKCILCKTTLTTRHLRPNGETCVHQSKKY
jgi:hypothetical protein